MKKAAVLLGIILFAVIVWPQALEAETGQITSLEPEGVLLEAETPGGTEKNSNTEEIRITLDYDEYRQIVYRKGQDSYQDSFYCRCENFSSEQIILGIASSNPNAVKITSETTQMVSAEGSCSFWISYQAVGAGISDIVVTAGEKEYKIKIYAVPEKVELKNIIQSAFKSITLQWEKVPGCSGYRIERAQIDKESYWPKTDYQTVAAVYGEDSTSAVIQAEWGIQYRYRVIGFVEDELRRAEEKDGNSSFMDFTAEKLKARISSVKISGKSSLAVCWEAMPGASAYKLYCSTEENGNYTCIYTANSTGTSYTQKVNRGVTYYYKVTAIFPEGESDFSASISQFIPKKGKKKSVSANKLGQRYVSGQYSGNWAHSDYTYYYISKGTLYVVCVQSNGNLKVFKLSNSLKIKSTRTIKLKYDVWGGFYAGADGNFYVAVGYHNYNESKTKTVIKIIKYNSKWKKGKTAKIKGGASNMFSGIYEPFEAGSCRMDLQGDMLYVATARKMFMHSDGLRHQSNISFLINTKTMKEEKAPHAYVSHSFNQFVRFKDESLYLLNHGDAYPRSLALTVFSDYGSEFQKMTEDDTSLFSFQGKTGENFTGCKVGGMEIGGTNVLVCGIAQPHKKKVKGVSGYGYNYKYNVFLSLSDRKTGKVKILWLTDYHPKSSSVTVGETRMVKLCDDRFAILYSTTEKGKSKLNYVVVSDTGKKIYSTKYSGLVFDGDSQPILYKGKIIWADTALGNSYRIETKLYSIPAIY